MTLEQDVVPELLKSINQQFDAQAAASKKLQAAARALKSGKATYQTANSFAVEVGDIMAQVLQRNLKSETLPDQKMYYNIAQRVLNDTLKKNFDLVSGYSGDVQKLLNDNAGIGLQVQHPEFNQDRVDGLVNRLASEQDFEKVKWILDDPVVNFTQSIVDDSIDANCKFQSKAGLHPIITRRLMGRACKWCKDLVGTYDYDDLPDDIYRRHENCRCIVEYNPGSGKRQDVWTKKWKNPANDAKIEDRKRFTPIPKEGFTSSKHARIRKSEREITNDDIAEALKNPIKVFQVETDEFGRQAQKYVGSDTTVVMNPVTKQVITTYPTSTHKRKKYLKERDDNV